jgi:hypothetical protein
VLHPSNLKVVGRQHFLMHCHPTEDHLYLWFSLHLPQLVRMEWRMGALKLDRVGRTCRILTVWHPFPKNIGLLRPRLERPLSQATKV